MDQAGITYVDEGGGARIALCEHRQELCHRCCSDYTTMNNYERERAKAAEARKCWAPDCSSEARKTCQVLPHDKTLVGLGKPGLGGTEGSLPEGAAAGGAA